MRSMTLIAALLVSASASASNYDSGMNMSGGSMSMGPSPLELDNRHWVVLAVRGRLRMQGAMREEMSAINQIEHALAEGQFARAAAIAEDKLGTKSKDARIAGHIVSDAPKGLQRLGDRMQERASAFAKVATKGNLHDSLAALAKVTDECVACHATYRIR